MVFRQLYCIAWKIFCKLYLVYLLSIFPKKFLKIEILLPSACWDILHNRLLLPLDFFSNITSFSYFLDCQNPDFFPFSNSQFLPNRTRQTYVHQCEWMLLGYNTLSAHISALLWCCCTISSDFLWKSALNLEIYAENSKNFNKIGNVLDPRTKKQMLIMCASGLRNCVMTSWIFNEL